LEEYAMMTIALLPERKINKPAVAMSFAAQAVFIVVLIQLGHIQPARTVFAAKHMIYTPVVSAEVTPKLRPQIKPVGGTGSSVEIISKPRPGYTEDGRKHSVEGEVTLEVMFTAAKQVLVVRVVRGLGYGPDEQAIRAAQQIRFKPAQLGGQPIDSRAVVHIIFQLAS
jgi:TonB family protein